MDRYKAIPKLAGNLSQVCAVILAKAAYDWSAYMRLNQTSVFLVMVVAFKLTQVIVDFLFEQSFQHGQGLRRRLLGNQYVEGTWIELVRLAGQPYSVSITHLSPDGYKLSLSGTNYELNGAQKSSFHSDMIEIRWPYIECKHSNQPLAGQSARLEGYGELQFPNTGAVPRTYTGFFMHLTEGQRYNADAMRLTDADTLKQLEDPSSRIALLKTYANSLRSLTSNGAGA